MATNKKQQRKVELNKQSSIAYSKDIKRNALNIRESLYRIFLAPSYMKILNIFMFYSVMWTLIALWAGLLSGGVGVTPNDYSTIILKSRWIFEIPLINLILLPLYAIISGSLKIYLSKRMSSFGEVKQAHVSTSRPLKRLLIADTIIISISLAASVAWLGYTIKTEPEIFTTNNNFITLFAYAKVFLVIVPKILIIAILIRSDQFYKAPEKRIIAACAAVKELEDGDTLTNLIFMISFEGSTGKVSVPIKSLSSKDLIDYYYEVYKNYSNADKQIILQNKIDFYRYLSVERFLIAELNDKNNAKKEVA